MKKLIYISLGIAYRPDLPEAFFGEEGAFFVFGAEVDAFTWDGAVTLAGSGSAGASFGW